MEECPKVIRCKLLHLGLPHHMNEPNELRHGGEYERQLVLTLGRDGFNTEGVLVALLRDEFKGFTIHSQLRVTQLAIEALHVLSSLVLQMVVLTIILHCSQVEVTYLHVVALSAYH